MTEPVKQPFKLITISESNQDMRCFENDELRYHFIVSTAKNGLGEKVNSECTPRGWHRVYSVIGQTLAENSVLVGRMWTGEIYSEELSQQFPNRDWILTRIIQLDGLEYGRNKGGEVDSLNRYIYLHGTPDTTKIGVTGSKGCVRMRNDEIILLATWLDNETLVYIE